MTIQIDEVFDTCSTLDEGKFDMNFPLNQVEFLSEQRIRVNDRVLHLTYHSFRQLFNSLVKPVTITDFQTYEYGKGDRKYRGGAGYVWNSEDMFAPNMNRLVELNASDNEFLFRCQNEICRGVLTQRYQPVANTEILTKIFGAIEFHHIANFKITPDIVVCDLVIKDYISNDGEYGIGYRIRNDEIGVGSLEIGGTIKRAVCDNSIVVKNPMRFYHSGDLYSRLATKIANLPLQMEHAEQLFFKFEAAKEETFSDTDFALMVENARKAEKLDEQFLEAFFKGTEGQKTLAGFVNGITFAAHTLYSGQPLKQHYYETLASKYL